MNGHDEVAHGGPANQTTAPLAGGGNTRQVSKLDGLFNNMRIRDARGQELSELGNETELDFVSYVLERLGTQESRFLQNAILLRIVDYFAWRKKKLSTSLMVFVRDAILATEYFRDTKEPDAPKPAPDDRQAFLAMRDHLLANHRNQYIAFAQGRLLASANTFDSLMDTVQHVPAETDVYVGKVDPFAFLDPQAVDIPGVL